MRRHLHSLPTILWPLVEKPFRSKTDSQHPLLRVSIENRREKINIDQIKPAPVSLETRLHTRKKRRKNDSLPPRQSAATKA